MLSNGRSKDNLHQGTTKIASGDLEVDGNLTVDGTINLSDVTVDGNLTINPPNCLKTDCIEEATLNNGVGVESDLNINATKNLSTDKINPTTPASFLFRGKRLSLKPARHYNNRIATSANESGPENLAIPRENLSNLPPAPIACVLVAPCHATATPHLQILPRLPCTTWTL